MQPIQVFFAPYFPFIQSISIALAILIAGWIASGWAYRLALKVLLIRQLDPALGRFLASMVRYMALSAVIITSMETVGIQTTSLIAILASAGLAVGLALQGSLSNFASGVLILFFKHFQLGDKVGVAEMTGIVDDIGLFTTTLISADNEKIMIPNASVTGGPIVNYSDRGHLRGSVVLTLSAELPDLGRVTEALLRGCKRAQGVAQEPAAGVMLTDMEEGSFDFTVAFWYKALEEEETLHNVRIALLEELAASGIKLMNRPQVLIHQRGKAL